jgi:hypothetical protein
MTGSRTPPRSIDEIPLFAHLDAASVTESLVMATSLRIPEQLLHASDLAGNGERFWSRDVAGAAARWLAAQDLAIAGGEVYRRHSGAWGTYVREWVTEPGWGKDESWAEYVERGLAQALRAVEHDRPEWNEFPDVRTQLLYFFAYWSPADYQSPTSTPDDLWL